MLGQMPGGVRWRGVSYLQRFVWPRMPVVGEGQRRR